MNLGSAQFYIGYVNMKSTGTTTIHVLDDRPFVVLHAFAVTWTQTGTVLLAPTFSVGTNGSNYNNIVPLALFGLNTVGTALTLLNQATYVAAGGTITCNVTIATTGASAQTAMIIVVGVPIPAF